jgi:hypothetical protein
MSLVDLVDNTRTDKNTDHSYLEVYDVLLKSKKHSALNVLEVGIGDGNQGATNGGSIKLWKDYFPNALIVGADIDKLIMFQEERIQTYYVDQLDTDSIGELWQLIGGGGDFDIMIDDGLHTVEAAINLFACSIDFLKNSGTYIIEDVTMQRLSGLMEYFYTKPFKTALFSSHRVNCKVGDNMLLVIQKA